MDSSIGLIDKIHSRPKGSPARSFWIGKALQKNIGEEFREEWKEVGSSLSEGISSLLVRRSQAQITLNNIIVDGTINWNILRKNELISLSPISEEEIQLLGYAGREQDEIVKAEEEIEFRKVSPFMIELGDQFLLLFQSMSESDFLKMYEKQLLFYPYDKHLWNVISLLQEPKETSAYLCSLILSSYLERFLGDIYVYVKKSQAGIENQRRNQLDQEDELDDSETQIQCPALLRELLVTPELIKALGDDIVFILRLCIGPPTGFNFRNITWHGFPTSKEYSTSYSAMIAAIYLSLPKVAIENLGQKLTFRPLSLMNRIPDDHYEFGMGVYSLPDRIPYEDEKVIINLLERSNFVFPGRVNFIKEAINEYNKASEFGNPIHYHRSICILLPQLEHSLRRIYVAVNDLHENMLKAVAKLYYTTLDLLISPYLEDAITEIPVTLLMTPDRLTPNKLPLEIGLNVFNLLHDLFLHRAGPQLRNKISHGLVDVNSVNRVLPDRIISLFIYLSVKYDISHDHNNYIIRNCVTFYDNYRSCFHGKVLLLKEMRSCHRSWSKLGNFLREGFHDDEEENELSWVYKMRPGCPEDEQKLDVQIERLQNSFKDSYQTEPLFANDFTKELEEPPWKMVNTVFVPPDEISKVVVLRKLTRVTIMMSDKFLARLQELRREVLEGTATRRAQDSLYKLNGFITHFWKCLQFLMLSVEESFWSSSNDTKWITNCLITSEKMIMKIDDNQWPLLLQIWYKFFAQIKPRKSTVRV